MRGKTLLSLVIIGIAAVIVWPAITSGQPGGFGKGGKNKGGFGGGNMDPGALFDLIARGKPAIEISSSRSREQLTKFAAENGITNGQINRDQFIQYMQQAQSKLTAPAGNAPNPSPGGNGQFGGPQQGGGFNGGGGGFQGGGFNGGGGFQGGGGFKGGFGGNKGGPRGMDAETANLNPEAVNQWADASFKKADRNGDGKLNKDEMPPPLLANLVKYDRNGDGMIDQAEFREYFMARVQGADDNRNSSGIASIIIEEEELDRKVVVFRAGGQMPAGLPAWFKELDTDNDGQVALYEWRRGGKDINDFASWDLNDDGFITPEEALRQQTVIARSTPNTSAASTSLEGERPNFGGGFGGGQFGGGQFGGGKVKNQRPAMGNGENANPFGGGAGAFGKGFGKNNKKGKKTNGGN